VWVRALLLGTHTLAGTSPKVLIFFLLSAWCVFDE
jgi:hypothetical protein